MKEKYYSIGNVSDICNISIKTLRYYDKINVLVPKYRNNNTKYRYYSHEQMVQLFIIKQLRCLGFSLQEIKNILEAKDLNLQYKIIEKKKYDLEKEINELTDKYIATKNLSDKILKAKELICKKELNEEKAEFSIVFQDELTVFGKKKKMNSYKNEKVNLENWIELIEAAKAKNLNVKGDIFVTYHTELLGQFIYKDCEVEFSIAVREDSGEFLSRMGGFCAVTTTYIGDYSDIIHTYILLKRWIEEKELEVTGPITEQFILSPIDIPNIDSHIVKIIVPVRYIKDK